MLTLSLRCRTLGSILCVMTCGFCAASSQADSIIGITLGYTPGTAPLVSIDPATGSYAVLSTAGNSYNSLAQNSQGDLFAAFFSSSSSEGRIARLNPATGAPVQVFNAITPGAGSVRGLAFDNSDRLFAVVNRDDTFGSPTISTN